MGGGKVTPTRKSDAYFGISRNTGIEVYERLLNEGYVVTRHGSGTYVADRLPASPPRPSSHGGGSPDHRLNKFWLRPEVTAAMSFWRDQPERPSSLPQVLQIDFRPALVDSRLFPFDVFRRVIAKQLRGLERRPASFKSPQGNQGNYYLRDAIIKHIALARAVVCQPEDTLVTPWVHHAFGLLALGSILHHDT